MTRLSLSDFPCMCTFRSICLDSLQRLKIANEFSLGNTSLFRSFCKMVLNLCPVVESLKGLLQLKFGLDLLRDSFCDLFVVYSEQYSSHVHHVTLRSICASIIPFPLRKVRRISQNWLGGKPTGCVDLWKQTSQVKFNPRYPKSARVCTFSIFERK